MRSLPVVCLLCRRQVESMTVSEQVPAAQLATVCDQCWTEPRVSLEQLRAILPAEYERAIGETGP